MSWEGVPVSVSGPHGCRMCVSRWTLCTATCWICCLAGGRRRRPPPPAGAGGTRRAGGEGLGAGGAAGGAAGAGAAGGGGAAVSGATGRTSAAGGGDRLTQKRRMTKTRRRRTMRKGATQKLASVTCSPAGGHRKASHSRRSCPVRLAPSACLPSARRWRFRPSDLDMIFVGLGACRRVPAHVRLVGGAAAARHCGDEPAVRHQELLGRGRALPAGGGGGWAAGKAARRRARRAARRRRRGRGRGGRAVRAGAGRRRTASGKAPRVAAAGASTRCTRARRGRTYTAWRSGEARPSSLLFAEAERLAGCARSCLPGMPYGLDKCVAVRRRRQLGARRADVVAELRYDLPATMKFHK